MRERVGATSTACFVFAAIIWGVLSFSDTFKNVPGWVVVAIISVLLAVGSVSGLWFLLTLDGDSPKLLYGLLTVLFIIFGAVWLALGEWVWRYKFRYNDWYKNEYWVVGICIFFAIAFFIAWLFSYKPDDLDQFLDAKYSSTMNPRAANYQAKRSAAQTNLLQHLTNQTQAKADLKRQQIDYQYAVPKAKEQRKLEVSANEAQVAKNEQDKKVIQAAGQRGYTVETDQKILETRELSQIKIDEAKKMGEEELRREIEKMQEQVRIAIIADRLGDHQMIELILEQIERLHVKMSDVRQNVKLDQEAKTQILSEYAEYILTLSNDRRDREGRLVQAPNRQRLPEGQQTDNLRGDYREDPQAGEE